MSTLQCANIWFESTANNRLQYSGSNGFSFVAGGANLFSVNTTAVSISGTLNYTINALSVSTNTANIGTALYVLASGNVGIGTSNPQYGKLQVNGKVYAGDTIQSGNSFILQGNGMVTTNSSNNLLIGINEVEKARFDTSGRLLIGLTAPYGSSGERLTVNGMVTIVSSASSTGNSPLYVYNTDTTASNNQPFINFHDGSSIRGQLGCNYTDGAMWLNGAFGIRFRHNSGEVARFDSGTLAINTTTPDTTRKMHIYAAGTVGGTPQLLLEGGTNGYGAGITFQSRTSAGGTLVEMARVVADGDNSWNTTASTQDARLSFWTTQDGTSTERMRITSDGRVAIGTTTPSTRFQVSTGATGGIALLQGSARSFYLEDDGSNARISTEGSGPFAIRAASSGDNHLVISTSGRVTKPYQPGFRAYSPTAAAGATTISFGSSDTAFNSRNAGWNGSTRYTAPVTGMYLFSFSFLHNTTGASYARVGFRINGTASYTNGDTLNDGYNSYGHTGMAMVFQLNANDYVELYNEGAAIYGTGYGSFSGYLIG